MPHFSTVLRAFLVAVATTALVAFFRHVVLVEYLGGDAPLMSFILAAILAAWIDGVLSGLMATAMGAAVGVYLIRHSHGTYNVPVHLSPRVLTFVVMGTSLSWGFEFMHRTRRRLEERQRQLETRQDRLEHEIAERQKAEAAVIEQREQLTTEMRRRAAAELALREREERMRMAVDSADIGTWDFNPITGERNWSDRTKLMFGLPPDADVTNVTYLERIHPDDQERARLAVESALRPESNGRYEIECRLLLPSGSVGWFVVKGQAFFDGEVENRRPIRFIGTVMEITERKKAEQALRLAEERFRNLATYAPVGIFQVDERGSCIFVNDAWCKIVGATEEQAKGNGWARFLHAEDRHRVHHEWQEAVRNRHHIASEFRFVNRREGIRWVAGSATPLLDDAGTVSGYVGTIVDLTDRKAIEDVVRADEARLRSILDNTPAIISLKDLAGRYVLVNRVWEELYGVTNEEIAGLTNYDLLKKTRSSHMSVAIADQFAVIDCEVVEHGKPVEFEDPIADGDDKRLFFTVKFPITDANGTITGIGGITTDITERRRAMDSLKAEQEMLRHTLQVQDHERQLISYEIHDGLVQYAAGALMQLEALRAGGAKPGTEALQKLVEILRRAVAEGRRLINGLRTPVLDDFGVVAALEHLINEEDRAHVQVEFVKDDGLERLDPKIEETIYRITQEALTNIGKHSRSKNVRVELGRRGDRVHLEVRDWGVGFSPTGRTQLTHGLRGMTERARIVGGVCKIESAPGTGTRVVVELPLQFKIR